MFGNSKIVRLAAMAGLVMSLGALVPVASAQDAGTRPFADQGGHMGAALGLSDAQRAQLQQIRARARQQADQIRATTQGEAQGQALRQLHERTRTEMRSVLTPDQQARMAQMRGGHHRGGRGMRMRQMAERLQLSDAQRTQIQTIRRQAHEQVRAIHQQTRAQIEAQLTPAQRAMLPNRHQ